MNQIHTGSFLFVSSTYSDARSRRPWVTRMSLNNLGQNWCSILHLSGHFEWKRKNILIQTISREGKKAKLVKKIEWQQHNEGKLCAEGRGRRTEELRNGHWQQPRRARARVPPVTSPKNGRYLSSAPSVEPVASSQPSTRQRKSNINHSIFTWVDSNRSPAHSPSTPLLDKPIGVRLNTSWVELNELHVHTGRV